MAATTDTTIITRESLPILLSARDAAKIGITRSMFYRLVNRADIPIVSIGERKFLNRDRFFEWLDQQTDAVI